jgi:hypothetical protein
MRRRTTTLVLAAIAALTLGVATGTGTAAVTEVNEPAEVGGLRKAERGGAQTQTKTPPPPSTTSEPAGPGNPNCRPSTVFNDDGTATSVIICE